VWVAIASTTVIKGLLLAALFGYRYGRGNVNVQTLERFNVS
jgi:hypothetical protein